MRAVGRIFAAIFGYIAAILAAALFMLVARVDVAPPADPGLAPVYWTEFAVYAAATTGMLGSMSFLPAMGMILVTEIFSIRSFVVHTAFGGLLGAGAALGFGHLMPAQIADPARATVVVAAGFVGGFVYWLVAGRTAGLRPFTAEPPAR